MRGTAETPDLILSGEIGVNKTINTESLNIYENGNYTPPAGVDGYDDIHVDVRPVIDSITIRENGTYEASGEVDGYSPVVVNVPQSAAKVYAKNINANGNYYPDEGYDGFSQVSVNVPETPLHPLNVTENGEYNPPSGEGYSKVIVDVPTAPEIESITITENGTYTAPTGVDGYSPVIVNVPQPEDAYYIKDMTPGAIASFDDGADMVLPSLTVSIEPVQAGSGDPSPSNVRPISGWSACKPSVVGKNWFNKATVNVDKFINGDGGLSDSTYNQDVTDFIPVFGGLNYMISHSINQNFFSCFYDENKNKLGNVFGNDSFPIQAPNNARYIRITFGKANIDEFQVEIGTTASQYEPYNGTTTTIPFVDGQGQSVEVFGGSVDVVNGGEQPRTFVKVIEDGTIGNWNYNAQRKGFSKPFGSATMGENAMMSGNCQSFKANWLKTLDSDNTGEVTGIIFGLRNQYIFVTGVEEIVGTSPYDWLAYLREHPLELWYELATPTTFFTQPTSIKSLDGENNVWASTGDVLSGTYFSETPA